MFETLLYITLVLFLAAFLIYLWPTSWLAIKSLAKDARDPRCSLTNWVDVAVFGSLIMEAYGIGIALIIVGITWIL